MRFDALTVEEVERIRTLAEIACEIRDSDTPATPEKVHLGIIGTALDQLMPALDATLDECKSFENWRDNLLRANTEFSDFIEILKEADISDEIRAQIIKFQTGN